MFDLTKFSDVCAPSFLSQKKGVAEHGVVRLGPGRSGADAVDGNVIRVDVRTDGRKMSNIKDSLTECTRRSEHHDAHVISSAVMGEKLESPPATLCLTEADSEYLVETADLCQNPGTQCTFSTVGFGTCARAVVEGCSEVQAKWKTLTEPSTECVEWRASSLFLSARLVRHAAWSVSRFHVKNRGRTALEHDLENRRSQD